VDKKIKGKIIIALRKLTFAYPPRNSVRKRAKIGPASFQCELCSRKVYEGTRNIETIGIDGLEKGKIVIDHLDPVVPIEGFPNKTWDWNIFIERLFCEEEGLQAICKSCHDNKTKQESELRRKK
jgi:hypothetical protein